MNNNLVKILLGSMAALSTVGLTPNVFAQYLPNNTNRANTYQCLMINNKPTTVVNTPRGRISLIVWQSGFFASSGWSPERRCVEVSKRFQQYENTGNLQYISTGTLNGYKIICVAEKLESLDSSVSYQCQDNGLILTLEHKDDPNKVMRELFNLTARSTAGPITRGSQPTTVAIDLEDFLEKAETIEEDTNTSEDNKLPENVTPTIPAPTPETPIETPNSSTESHLDLCSKNNSICSNK